MGGPIGVEFCYTGYQLLASDLSTVDLTDCPGCELGTAVEYLVDQTLDSPNVPVGGSLEPCPMHWWYDSNTLQMDGTGTWDGNLAHLGFTDTEALRENGGTWSTMAEGELSDGEFFGMTEWFDASSSLTYRTMQAYQLTW